MVSLHTIVLNFLRRDAAAVVRLVVGILLVAEILVDQIRMSVDSVQIPHHRVLGCRMAEREGDREGKLVGKVSIVAAAAAAEGMDL